MKIGLVTENTTYK